ncbi:lipase family protein [Kaarinaea lacus]
MYSVGVADPENIAFVFKAYDTIYNWNRVADFFQTNYVDVVNTSYDGLHDQTTTSDNLVDVTANLFNSVFLNEVLGDGELEVKAALVENDIYNWVPSAPVRLFHGQVDDLVPYANSTTARDAMVSNGTTNVELVGCVPPNNVVANHLNFVGCVSLLSRHTCGYDNQKFTISADKIEAVCVP